MDLYFNCNAVAGLCETVAREPSAGQRWLGRERWQRACALARWSAQPDLLEFVQSPVNRLQLDPPHQKAVAWGSQKHGVENRSHAALTGAAGGQPEIGHPGVLPKRIGRAVQLLNLQIDQDRLGPFVGMEPLASVPELGHFAPHCLNP